MQCPFCGHNNISGTDECDSCGGDLASLDGIVPKTAIEKVLMSDPINHLSPREAVVISPEATVLEVVRKMNEAKIGSVLVVSQGELKGIVTERDVVLKVISEERDPSKVSVQSIMTSDPETLAGEDTLAYAVNRMAVGRYRHIPILKGHQGFGIISVRDVLKYLSRLFS